MAKKEKGLGSVKRFGPRYGRTVKHRLRAIEKLQKAKHKCPYCTKTQVKRLSSGIFTCAKCNNTFTGKAYFPAVEKPVPVTQAPKEAPVEEEAEEEVEV